MKSQYRIALAIVIGLAGAFLVHFWWHSELASLTGDAGAGRSFHCLVIAGAEDCASYSLIGLHGKNLIASLLYYSFVSLVIWASTKVEVRK